MKMNYDPKHKDLRFECWREKGEFGCFYQEFADKVYDPIKCSFDFTIESSKNKGVVAVGLLGSEGDLLSGIKLYGLDSRKMKISGSDSILSVGQKYQVLISRQLDVLEVSVGGRYGKVVYSSKECVDGRQELGYCGFGITNKGNSSRNVGPIIVSIDDLEMSFLR